MNVEAGAEADPENERSIGRLPDFFDSRGVALLVVSEVCSLCLLHEAENALMLSECGSDD